MIFEGKNVSLKYAKLLKYKKNTIREMEYRWLHRVLLSICRTKKKQNKRISGGREMKIKSFNIYLQFNRALFASLPSFCLNCSHNVGSINCRLVFDHCRHKRCTSNSSQWHVPRHFTVIQCIKNCFNIKAASSISFNSKEEGIKGGNFKWKRSNELELIGRNW